MAYVLRFGKKVYICFSIFMFSILFFLFQIYDVLGRRIWDTCSRKLVA